MVTVILRLSCFITPRACPEVRLLLIIAMQWDLIPSGGLLTQNSKHRFCWVNACKPKGKADIL